WGGGGKKNDRPPAGEQAAARQPVIGGTGIIGTNYGPSARKLRRGGVLLFYAHSLMREHRCNNEKRGSSLCRRSTRGWPSVLRPNSESTVDSNDDLSQINPTTEALLQGVPRGFDVTIAHAELARLAQVR